MAAPNAPGSTKARLAIKIDMVKPIPANNPIRVMLRQVTPAGSAHQPRRTISQLTRTIPKGLPATSATATATMTQ
ncbi:hypothetical protein D3C76_1774300 [compost metagenome]